MPEPQLERKMTLKFRTPHAEKAVIADADYKKQGAAITSFPCPMPDAVGWIPPRTRK